MEPTVLLRSDRLYYRRLEDGDAGGPYCRWMNDPEVTRYLVSGARQYSPEDLKTYIAETNAAANALLLGFFESETGRHLGNVKLGDVRERHKRADLGIVVGDREKWGQGFGSEAIRSVTSYAFASLGLHKLTAGCYEENLGSCKAFLKAGYVQEGFRRDQFFANGVFVNEILLGCVSAG